MSRTNRSGNRIRHDQGRRGQECLFGIGVNPAIEVTITRQHRVGGIEVTINNFLLDDGSNSPDIPLYVVQAKATIPKPSVSSHSTAHAVKFRPLCPAKMIGAALRPKRIGLSPTGPQPMPSGLACRCQPIAAMMTAPSGIRPRFPGTFNNTWSRLMAMPLPPEVLGSIHGHADSGPAILRPTVDSQNAIRAHTRPLPGYPPRGRWSSHSFTSATCSGSVRSILGSRWFARRCRTSQRWRHTGVIWRWSLDHQWID